MNTKEKLSIKNEYHLELIDVATGELKQLVNCHNTVLAGAYSNQASGASVGEPIWISIGTGNTVPKHTDTGLAQKLHTCDVGPNYNNGSYTINNAIVMEGNVCVRTMKASIDAASCIGALTEIGISNGSNGRMLTRALFTDSEGNAIVINKTVTDILNITVKVYYTLTIQPHPAEGTDVFLCPVINHYGLSSLVGGAAITPGVATFLPTKATQYVDDPEYSFGKSINYGTVNNVLYGTVELLYSEGYGINEAFGYDVKSIHIRGIGVFNVTPDIFPPTPFPKYQVGVGDGTNKEFNIKTPSCKENTQKVYVDGVLKTEGVDYTFYNINTKEAYTNYLSADANNVVFTNKPELFPYESGRSWAGMPVYPVKVPGNGYAERYWDITNVKPFVFDFKTPVTVSCIKIGPNMLSDFKNTVKLQYSTDGTTWLDYASMASLDLNSFNVLPEVTARYWRYSTTSSAKVITRSYSWSIFTPVVLFGHYVPNIIFATAPSLNAVVEIEYDIEYPFHNHMHSMRFSYTHETIY